MSASPTPTIYVVYNAKSTLYGKLQYVYRKTTCPDPSANPACAACELTHGPSLRLSESPQWIKTKQRIHNATVVQVHQDEMSPALRAWVKKEQVSSPAVVAGEHRGDSLEEKSAVNEGFTLLLSADDLARVRHDHDAFLATLQQKLRDNAVQGVDVDMSA